MWLYLTLVLVCSIGNSLEEEKAECQPPHIPVFLTVSSVVDDVLELNWEVSSVQQDDWVGLFTSDPKTNWSSPLAQVTVLHEKGWYFTNVSADEEIDWDLTHGDQCLNYWIGFVRNNATLYSDCLKIRPTWMWDHRSELENLPLNKLFLPGTHNSGCVHANKQRSGFFRFLLTQDVSVWQQLVAGIRYLDIRVGYYSHLAERFWVNHDLLRIAPLLPLLQDVKKFLRETKEIVILDFHRFPVGFSRRQRRHRRLVSLITEELGEFMAPAWLGHTVTLKTLWTTHSRLLVFYKEKIITNESQLLWHPLAQEWGDKQSPEDLKKYLDSTVKKKESYNKLWAAMAELTPTTMDIFFRPTLSLKHMADNVNRNVTEWFQKLWWRKTNIVAADFFRGSNLIDVAIEANRKKASC